jgi:carbohydrate-binding DOMON domain-containing protein
MDIESMTLEAGPTTLRVKLAVGELSTAWNPSNGFDHVCLNVYFDVPDAVGATLLPKVQASAPSGFAWDFVHFAYGWGNNAYAAAGASDTLWGTPVNGRPGIKVDAASRTIVFEYQASTFGLTTWEGVRVYVTSWDFDGIDARFRPLGPEATQWTMGGGAATDPLIMDDIGPVLIPITE